MNAMLILAALLSSGDSTSETKAKVRLPDGSLWTVRVFGHGAEAKRYALAYMINRKHFDDAERVVEAATKCFAMALSATREHVNLSVQCPLPAARPVDPAIVVEVD